MSTYNVFLSIGAKKQLTKIKDHKEQIKKELKDIEYPYYHLQRLTKCSWYKVRVRDYRIIKVIEDKHILCVLLIEHRSKVYKKLSKLC